MLRQAATEGSESSGEAGSTSPDGRASDPRDAILFLGTSLTAGYGLDGLDDAYPARIQARIDAAGLPFRVVNAGVSGDTSAGGLRRLEFLLEDAVSVLVLELGANDGLRGLPPEQLSANLQSAIDLARTRHPGIAIILAGMEAPTNMGVRYRDSFRAVYAAVAQSNGTDLIPFLLEGVAGSPEMNQDDRIHPTARGHEMIAETVWMSLGPLLSSRAGG